MTVTDHGATGNEVRDDLLARKVALLYDHLPGGVAVNVAVGVVVVLFVSTPGLVLTATRWGEAVALVSVLRLATFVFYRHHATTNASAAHWLKLFIAGATAQGLLYAFLGVVLVPQSSPVDQLFLLCTLTAMSGGAVSFLSAVWGAYVGFLIPTVIPVSIVLLAGDLAAQRMAGVLGLVYAAAMMYASIKTSRSIAYHIGVSFEKETLTAHVQAANLDLERHRAHLEGLVEDRTQELIRANERLRAEIRDKDTEKRKAELSEARFRELAELLPEVIYEMDVHGNVTFLNQKFHDMTGYDCEGISRLPSFTDLFIPEDEARLRANLRRLLAGEMVGPNEYTARRRDGTPCPVLAVSSRIMADGEVRGVRGIIIDTTQVKELEGKIRHSAKMEAMGTMAGGIAHDFNNILTAIMGYSEMASRLPHPDPELGFCLGQIVRATERARQLVAQILTFSRKGDVTRRSFAIAPVVREALEFVSASIPATICVLHDIHDACGSVEADETQVQQVVVNLCTNAYHAMKGAGGELRVSLQPVEVSSDRGPGLGLDPGPYVELVVADTGPGVDPAIRSRIFDPFFTTRAVGEGTGMGLSVVHGIVRSGGGCISLDEAPGEGATFRVLLPRKEAAASDGPAARHRDGRGTERILFVDDEPAIREIAGLGLGSLGYSVTVASDGLHALQILEDGGATCDLLISDLAMPVLSGVELARRARSLHPRLPVVLCSGNREALGLGCIEEAGVDLVVDKPFRIADLAVAIRRVLDQEYRGHHT